MKKKSIRQQVAFTTILMIAITILICVLANALFLRRVYVNNKKQNLIETYQFINEYSSKMYFFVFSIYLYCFVGLFLD